MPDYSRIAPFPVEQIEGETFKAQWADVAKAARALRKKQKREVPETFDVRSVAFWFGELKVLWNEDTIDVYQDDTEGQPWMVQWGIV